MHQIKWLKTLGRSRGSSFSNPYGTIHTLSMGPITELYPNPKHTIVFGFNTSLSAVDKNRQVQTEVRIAQLNTHPREMKS